MTQLDSCIKRMLWHAGFIGARTDQPQQLGGSLSVGSRWIQSTGATSSGGQAQQRWVLHGDIYCSGVAYAMA